MAGEGGEPGVGWAGGPGRCHEPAGSAGVRGLGTQECLGAVGGGACQADGAQVAAAEDGPGEFGALEIGVPQGAVEDLGAGQGRGGQVGVGEVDIADDGCGEVSAGKGGPAEVEAVAAGVDVPAGQVRAGQDAAG